MTKKVMSIDLSKLDHYSDGRIIISEEYLARLIEQEKDRARLEERHSAVASIAKEYDTLAKQNDDYFGADFKSGYYAALHDMTLDAKDRDAELEQRIAAREEEG